MGEQNLGAGDLPKEQRLTGGIEVSQHVVQKHNRPLSTLRAQEIDFGQP